MQYFVFVDLRKAYDSVPREALWTALKKLGVPDVPVGIIKSFHINMRARVRVDGELLEDIELNMVSNKGVRWPPFCSTSMLVWWLRDG